MTKWTTEQQAAIEQREKSLLVAAAAGSGKTAVLVERIIQMISDETNPVYIDNLLIVTFTKAAATEMKERIGAAISKQLELNPASAHLYQQSLLLRKAKITTLHSFCLELVHENFFLLNIDPRLKIASDVESQLILITALEEIFEEFYLNEDKQKDFIHLLDCYGGREDEKLQEVILSLYRTAQSMSLPKKWLQELPAQAKNIDYFSELLPYLEQKFQEGALFCMKSLRQITPESGLQKYWENLQNEHQWFLDAAQICQNSNWQQLERLMNDKSPFESLKPVKKNTYDEEAKEKVLKFRKKAKEIYVSVKEAYFIRSQERLENEIIEQQWALELLSEITLQVMARHQKLKQQKGLMDFSDMEHYCFQLLYQENEAGILVRTTLAEELRNKFTEVMVDEYQDINDLQESILQAVSKENNLFMVGDIKQSIYSFRMANPKLFMQKYNDFPTTAVSEKIRIDLNRNFRCRENIVDGVNEIFGQLMDGQQGELVYDANAALVYGAGYPECTLKGLDETIDLYILNDENDSNEDNPADDVEEQESLSTAESEGVFIARKILEMMEQKYPVYDRHSGNYRSVTWKDIVILLRSNKRSGEVYAQQLQQMGIPVATDSGTGYFSAWEVEIILAVLSIIDNPLQDIPLMAVLKAPFVNFSDDLLAELRLYDRKGYFYYCLLAAAENYPQVKEFLVRLEHWRTLSQQLELSTLIWQLYHETQFYEYVGALPNGLQRQANLHALHERARGYEQTSFKGVFSFLRFLEQMENKGSDLAPAKIISENENVVRIISVHKSKGLEFPIVILAGMGKKFNFQDCSKDFLLDKDYGLAFPSVDIELGLKYTTLAQKLLQEKMKKVIMQEEKRILYVAMTRAREKLLLVGSCKKIEEQGENPLFSCRSYLDWILAVERRQAKWSTTIISSQQLLSYKALLYEQEEWQNTLTKGQAHPDFALYQDKINTQLSWQYPFTAFTKVKAQSSVTELKQRLNAKNKENCLKQEFNFDTRPRAVTQNTALTSAEKGTLLHLLLNKVDLTQEVTLDYMQELVARLEVEEFIPTGYTEGISLDGIVSFFQSDIAKRLKTAAPKQRFMEQPFIVSLDAHYLEEELPEDEKANILVQGVIDCFWQEEDGWVLIDYKSDYLPNNNYQIAIDRYVSQIDLYAYAIEQIWGGKVKERYLYLITHQEFVAI